MTFPKTNCRGGRPRPPGGSDNVCGKQHGRTMYALPHIQTKRPRNTFSALIIRQTYASQGKEEHLLEGRGYKKTGTKAGAPLPSIRFSSLHSLFPHSPPPPAFDCSSQNPSGLLAYHIKIGTGGHMGPPLHFRIRCPKNKDPLCCEIHRGHSFIKPEISQQSSAS